MKQVSQSHTILYPYLTEDWIFEQQLIELAGRTAYKSEGMRTEDSYKKFVSMIVQRGHEAVLEFGHMAVKFVTDRGISHELVRHRLCSFVQESTRYCNYAQEKFGHELMFIVPSNLMGRTCSELQRWRYAMEDLEKHYLEMIDNGISPQMARSILPNSLKTEIVVKANFREWRHIFRLRAISSAAHPDMRALMMPLYLKVRSICPEVFDMGEPQ